MGNNLLVWYLAHTQHLKKPIRSEPICLGSCLLFEVKGLATRDYYSSSEEVRSLALPTLYPKSRVIVGSGLIRYMELCTVTRNLFIQSECVFSS